MSECRHISSLEDVADESVGPEEEPPLSEVRMAQRVAGGLN